MVEITKSLVAAGLVLTGLYLIVFGNAWGPAVFKWLPDTELGFWVELIVPFLPIAIIVFGAGLYVSTRLRK